MTDKRIRMDGMTYERCLVEVLSRLIEDRGLKHKPTAILAWPQRSDPGTKWRKIRNGTDPRGLQVCDAYDLATAIGISFVEACGLAQALFLQRNQAQLSPRDQTEGAGTLPPGSGRRALPPVED